MAFGTKKSVVAAPSFSERTASIKSMFKTAHENASNLHAEMESEIAKYVSRSRINLRVRESYRRRLMLL